MRVAAANMSICGLMINSKASVFDSGTAVVKAMEIDSKPNSTVKRRASVRRVSVSIIVWFDQPSRLFCTSSCSIEVCLLPKITGPCQSTGIRYYYDRDKKECQQFRYGGCNGNANNYETLEQCQSACEQTTVGKSVRNEKLDLICWLDQCTQPAEAGPCKGEHARFFYDTITGQCRSFTYGGCQKNENHFSTLKDCLKVCVGSRERGTREGNRALVSFTDGLCLTEICLQPKVVGTCQERRPTWYFDLTAQECKLFQYSGTVHRLWRTPYLTEKFNLYFSIRLQGKSKSICKQRRMRSFVCIAENVENALVSNNRDVWT